jgi:hypothetical protein
MRARAPPIGLPAMGRSSPYPNEFSGAGMASAEDLRDFRMLPPEAAAQPSASPSPGGSRSFAPSTPEQAERVNAAIVIVLTLACTALAFFDLLLLASGS